MSELARQERVVKRAWAAPGSSHDHLIRLLKIVLPVLIGLLGAYLVLAPLTKGEEISFLLDKNKVDVAKERMRIVGALYQGQDAKGRPFSLSAQSGVQPSSREPLVAIQGIGARMVLDKGPTTFEAPRARYNIETQKVAVEGPVRFVSGDGYRLAVGNAVIDLRAQTLITDQPALFVTPDGRRVATRSGFIDLNRRTVTSADAVVFAAPNGYRLQTGNAVVDIDDQRLVSNGAVNGRMPLGRFTAGRLMADLDERRVVLSGRARLHIVQGGLR